MKTVLLSYWADFEKLMIKIIRVKSQCLMMGSKYPWVDFMKVQLEPHAGWLVFELLALFILLYACGGVLLGLVTEKDGIQPYQEVIRKISNSYTRH